MIIKSVVQWILNNRASSALPAHRDSFLPDWRLAGSQLMNRGNGETLRRWHLPEHKSCSPTSFSLVSSKRLGDFHAAAVINDLFVLSHVPKRITKHGCVKHTLQSERGFGVNERRRHCCLHVIMLTKSVYAQMVSAWLTQITEVLSAVFCDYSAGYWRPKYKLTFISALKLRWKCLFNIVWH